MYFLQMFQQGPPISAALTTHSGPHSNTIHDLIGPGSSTASSMGSIVTTSTSTLAAAAIAQSFGVGQPVNSATMSHSPSPRYCKHIKLKMTFYLRLALYGRCTCKAYFYFFEIPAHSRITSNISQQQLMVETSI